MKKNKTKKKGILAFIRKPYIKNQISFTSTLYSSPNSENSIVSAGASTGFDIKLTTLLSWIFGAVATLWVATKFRRRK